MEVVAALVARVVRLGRLVNVLNAVRKLGRLNPTDRILNFLFLDFQGFTPPPKLAFRAIPAPPQHPVMGSLFLPLVKGCLYEQNHVLGQKGNPKGTGLESLWQ